MVVPRKFDVLKTSEANFEGKYANFKNIKFPRGNYQTDGSSTETLYCLNSVSPRMNTTAWRDDRLKPIRIGENLVLNYKALAKRIRK